MKKRAKRDATYKQMAFETAIRNPERYKSILKVILPFVDKQLDDTILLEIVSSLYLYGVVSTDEITIDENSTIDSISAKVIAVNATRNADGGFPKGYCSRFWTYMRTLSELGFVYARYNEPLKLSIIANMLIEDKLDEQEAFSIQAIKYNRKSPYRNVSNDFNFFKFIIEILKKRGKILYEQFVIATFSYDGSVTDFFDIINTNTFQSEEEVYNFLQMEYNTTLKQQTVTRDYPDVVLRLLLITGFISIQYKGKLYIYLNKNKEDYINDLLQVPISLTDTEKEDAQTYFTKLETFNNNLLNVVEKYNTQNTAINGVDYAQKALDIIKFYEIDENTLLDSIKTIGTNKNIIQAFKYISEPLKLEFYISLLLALKYGNSLAISPNYKADFLGMPISHAAGNQGDIEVFGKNMYWLIEVTLIKSKAQQLNNETTSVIRHFIESKGAFSEKYLSFVAPIIHTDVRTFYEFSIVQQRTDKQGFYIKPYSIEEFIKVTNNKSNFVDMQAYTKNAIEELKKRLFE